MVEKNICQNPKCCEGRTKIVGIKSLRLINQEKLILNHNIKQVGDIQIMFMNIFARQVVRSNGCEIILTT